MKGTPHTRYGEVTNVDDGEHLKVHAGTVLQGEAIRIIGEKLRARTKTSDLILFRKVTKYATKIVAEYTVHRGQALAYSREMEKGSAMAEVGLKKVRSDAGRRKR
uniref:Uncharacterized protein n=1 Tax=viral metagenome TaxID=1070528 RepID=A0A6M3JKN8_9ZZZZ